MDIKEILNFDYKLIPDEYADQILELIQSNDENNWNLVYQLMRGFEDIDEWHIEYYFREILSRYCQLILNDPFKKDDYRLRWKVYDYLRNTKPYK